MKKQWGWKTSKGTQLRSSLWQWTWLQPTTGCFFQLVPPRKVLSMELVPPNSKKWLSTLVPPKATRRAKNNQSQRIFTLSEWCSAALFKHYYTIFLVFIQLQNMWIRSFRAFSPQKLHHLQRRRLEPFLSSSSRLLSPCPAFGCWSRQPHVRRSPFPNHPD